MSLAYTYSNAMQHNEIIHLESSAGPNSVAKLPDSNYLVLW